MRPDILFPLFAPVTSLKGVGPRMAPLYERLCGKKLVDLLWHLPSGMIDRSYAPPLSHAEKGHVVTLTLTIDEHIKPSSRGKPTRIIAHDDTDEITLTFFSAKGDYLTRTYPEGKQVVVSGLLDRFGRGWSMSHPDYALPPERKDEIPRREAIYPLTDGLSRKMVGKTIHQALQKAPQLDEWLDENLIKREKWEDWKTSLTKAHDPNHSGTEDMPPACRCRLAYDELLADQLALAVIRKHHRDKGGRAVPVSKKLQKKLEGSLPFSLTDDQKKTIETISHDLSAPRRMLRLLQADVGAGKTIVALMAMMQAVEAGFQTVLMAPTEILAKQHAATLEEFLKPLKIKIGLLVGKSTSKKRKETLEALKKGTIKVAVGTHALFQKDVHFKNLALAIVDEQHRFGVQQRLQLSDKGKGVDVLVMTATPIPRTLTLTAYGDMDVSRMHQKPAGRHPIDTRLIEMTRLSDVIDGIGRQMRKGAQIYWVCPLVEESEKSDLAAAESRAELLRQHFGEDAVGLVHGQMKVREKDAAMKAFVDGKTRILVATTVIEVGVDVPTASVMVIEHSERFGLAQLHQLRGRIGRGAEKSTCLLLYQAPLGPIAKERLKMMRETEDGFRIAEADLDLRGPGEILGTRQSGMPTFRLANLIRDKELLRMASDEAQLILNKNPLLEGKRGEALRTLLYLFEKDAAVKLFRGG